MGRPKPSVQETQLTPSTLPPQHIIVRLGIPQGSNNFASTDEAQVERLVELGSRVKRSKIIVTRGDYAFVQLYPNPEGSKSKVEGEIIAIISKGDIKSWRKAGEWPAGFDAPAETEVEPEANTNDNVDSDSDGDGESGSDPGDEERS